MFIMLFECIMTILVLIKCPFQIYAHSEFWRCNLFISLLVSISWNMNVLLKTQIILSFSYVRIPFTCLCMLCMLVCISDFLCYVLGCHRENYVPPTRIVCYMHSLCNWHNFLCDVLGSSVIYILSTFVIF